MKLFVGGAAHDQCTKRKIGELGVIFARYAPPSRRLWATAAAAGFLAVFAPGASADVAMSGSFLATKDCPAFHLSGRAPTRAVLKSCRAIPILCWRRTRLRLAIPHSRQRCGAAGALGKRRMWNFSDQGASVDLQNSRAGADSGRPLKPFYLSAGSPGSAKVTRVRPNAWTRT